MTTEKPSMWDRTFPVLNHKRDNFPLASVPWEFIAPHEAQARRNHAQTLQRLAERGGLSAKEMLAVVTGQHWMQTCWKIDKVSPEAPQVTCASWLHFAAQFTRLLSLT